MFNRHPVTWLQELGQKNAPAASSSETKADGKASKSKTK
jgi:hypothetical protein